MSQPDSYYTNANPDLLALLPLTARRVLEIGCGDGALARAYRLRNPAAHLTGVEAAPGPAAVATSAFDRLVQGDAEALSDAEITGGAGRFDLVIMGDVLEHLRSPEMMLARMVGLLRPGGVLALSVPNIGHYSALRALVQGDWPRQDAGLFDRTHLAFFTRDSLLAMLRQAGLHPLRLRTRTLPPTAESVRWIEALTRLAADMGQDAADFRSRAEAVQCVALAQRPALDQPPPLRLHHMFMAPTLMEARTTVPADALLPEPRLRVRTAIRDSSVPPGPPGVAVLQRLRLEREVLLPVVARFVRAGWLLVVEYDDDPALTGQVNRRSADPATRMQNLALAHAVQTSTAHLRDLFLTVTPEVALFPNAVAALAPERSPRQGPARVFHGTLNRPGTDAVAAALVPAIAAFPDTVFHVAMDRAFFYALPTEHKMFYDRLDYPQYLAQMEQADVVLSPIQGRPEEIGKSDLKWVEAASRGAVMVASPAIYGATIRDGENGLIVASLPDWPRALLRLLANPDERARISATARAEIAASRLICHQTGMRRDWYLSLWDRRAALTTALLDRNPDLKALI
ncbi:MAG: methyltransferase domain-containing protein [Paracoccus sp. (in: a-proteobacteria)]|uniref:methyltransferase domain-containing protein n=1 Tax=Paracoccus sp. TaxID=267 RepID=UPI0026DEF047|nr:methyltransferase domain-containing protein [Paracoccus sp. (in: a-proteobacteria)]MDO5620214.1 methyltransferase domain-containing protein [Paracoccus sp. (in: a-proteobacteria)]